MSNAQAGEVLQKWWVTVDGFSPVLCTAPTRDKARYAIYLQYSDPYPCKFGEFLHKSTIRRADDRTRKENYYDYNKGWQ